MARDWDGLARDLLESKRESRNAIGLSTETDLSPLQVAALYAPETAHDMLATGIECDLHSACALGLDEQISNLSKATDLAEQVDGLPPLGWALLASQVSATKALLECGDKPDRELARIGFFVWETEAIGEGEWRPIHLSVTHGYSAQASELTEILVNAGGPLDTPCILGELPLHLACTYGWMAVISVLLKLGADVDSRTLPCSERVRRLSSPGEEPADHDITPLMVAVREGKVEAAKLLLERGADVNARSAIGRSALHVAANAWWQEDVQVVDVLLQAGADPIAQDLNGSTALDYAESRNFNQIAAQLKSHMR